ncbi:MAG: SUMF1/EgtB/PvdO family nonheme iron enzyme [Prochloraceae cyanobacterium]
MKKIALLVGVSEYESDFTNLPQAVKDVEAMAKVLVHSEMGDFDRSNIAILQNPERQKMEEAIEELFIDRQINDLVLLFFSGHGIKDENGKLYLAAKNTRKTKQGELIRSSAIAARFIHETMNRSSSMRQVIILDSCFSGAFGENLLAKDDGAIDLKQELGGEGRAILTSSASTQYSFEEKGENLSIYTRYLLEGIQTGKADRNKDGFISVGELHQYVSDRLQEIKPAMQPKIYLGKGGNTINLVRIPIGDFKEKYRQEIEQYCNGNEITFVGRKILDTLRVNLGLSAVEANQIESEFLEPLREEFNQKLQRYERDFTDALKQEVPLSEEDLDRLRKSLQQLLDLKDEDTRAIEAKVKSQIEAYKQRLAQYEQQLISAMRQENTLSQTTRNRLQQMQEQWQLSERDVAIIEKRANIENRLYKQKLSQYERSLISEIQKQYPLGTKQRRELEKHRINLRLNSEDVAEIENKITKKIEAYKQNLREYKQLLERAIANSYPISKEIRQELDQFKQVLQLRDEDVQKIEAKLVQNKSQKSSSIQLVNNPQRRGQFVKEKSQQRPQQSNSNIPRREYLKYIFFVGIGVSLALIKNLWPSGTTIKANNNTSDKQTKNPDKIDPPTNSQLLEKPKPEDEEKEPPKEANKPVATSSSLPLKPNQFETVTVNQSGQIITRNKQTAQQFSENLGNNLNLEMIAIPAGSFTMGSSPQERFSQPSERPQHQVNLKAFFIGKFQITQAQWQAVAKLPKIDRDLNPNPSNFKGNLRPVESISWDEAIEFCKRLSQQTGRKYRLPTEAEWEYAAKAGTTTPFYFGPTITSQVANFNARYPYLQYERYPRYRNTTTNVGSFPPNAFGLYDMHGNVWEWCQDNWHNNYNGAPDNGTAWLSNNNAFRVTRGGSWSKDARGCRSCARGKDPAAGRYNTLGLRVVLEV